MRKFDKWSLFLPRTATQFAKLRKTISKLSQHAKTATQNVYQAYTKGMQTKLSFLTRTSPDMEEYLQEPEKQLC